MGTGPNSAEQGALDKLLARCAGPGPSQRDLEQCGIFKTADAARREAKDADKQALAALAAAQASAQTSRDRLIATTLVQQAFSALQNQAILVLSTFMVAAREYDFILSVKARQPILGDVLAGLFISFIPEFAPLTRLFKALGVAEKEAPLLAIGLDRIGMEREGGQTFTQFAVARLDARSNNLVKSIRDPVRSQSGMDSASVEKAHAFGVINQAMSDALNRINTRLAQATMAEGIFFQFCFWSSDPIPKVKQALSASGLDLDPAYVVPFDTLKSLFLYDALRLYVKNYFVFHGQQGEKVEDLNPHQDEDQVEGLNAAQRELIYDRFRKVPWTDPTRPPVDGFRDLLKYWNGRYVADQRNVSNFVYPAGI
jgi:hypothetical protein